MKIGNGKPPGAGQTGLALEVRDAVKRFGEITAVDHVSLAIREGEIFSLLGPSGCGKTTLLRIVAGLETPDEGDVLIAGRVVNNVPPYKRDCSIVFQQLALFPHMSIFDNIAFGLVERRVAREEIRQRVLEVLAFVNLEGMETRRPSQLSGGQQQRVALARSLVLKPKVLLLDEPLASLDRKLRKEMQVELKRIQREVGTTFLYVTHDQKVALSLSDRIGVMKDGRVVQIGTSSEIYETPKTTFVASFMGATNIFLGEMISRGNGKIQLETREGLRILAPEPEEAECEKITGCSVHPELIQVLSETGEGQPLDPEENNAFHGTIDEVFYQGDFSELTVLIRPSNTPLTVHLGRGEAQNIEASPGKEVIARWNWRQSNVLVG
ncbi:MAG: ABC transporter ATP-binding protein [Deltaproteobacteria bacterium]|nr:ABC transporter ATP-binding protein [Deltaproteobacteria bacterium]